MKPIDIPQMEPWFGPEEANAVKSYMDAGGWITEFKNTIQFEDALAEYIGVRHCIACSNGTVALMMIAQGIGLKSSDEVIVPNYTMIATPNSVKSSGAKVVFVDVEKDTLCLDYEKVVNAITSSTKAIFLVNANGREPSVGIDAFRDLADSRGILLIEDSCQALGSRYRNGAHMGSIGLASAFSFSVPKIISTGQGGVIATNDDTFAKRMRLLKDFGRTGGGNDVHGTIGYNYKITELQAIIGLEQLKKLSWRVERKKEIMARYRESLSGIREVELFNQDLDVTTPWFIDSLVCDRNGLQNFLREKGIGTRVMYPPINKQLAYSLSGEFPVSNIVGEKGLWLPSSAQLEDSQVHTIADCIREFYAG